MRNEAADIVQDHPEEMASEWKTKARAAGTAAWDVTLAAYRQIHDKTAECSKATDHAIREKPYLAMGLAFGFGVLFALLATKRRTSEEN